MTEKFSEFADGGDFEAADKLVGLDADTADNASWDATDIAAYVEGTLDVLSAGVRWSTDTTTTPGVIYGNVDLATGVVGGSTLTGGSAAGDDLTLASTSEAAHGGDINLRDHTVLLSEAKTWTASSGVFSALDATGTVTMNGSSSGNTIKFVRLSPTISWDSSPYSLDQHTIISMEPNIANANGEARTMNSQVAMFEGSTIMSTTGAMTIGGWQSYLATPLFQTASGGTIAATSVAAFVATHDVVGDGVTITTRTAFQVGTLGVTGTGVVTTDIGLDVPTLTGATTMIGARIVPPMVHTPSASTMSAASSTIRIDRAVVRLNNTSGGSLTITAAPTMADGVDGQMAVIFNSSANDITLQDQGTLAGSNMRFVGTGVTLGQRESVQVMYSSTVGDWIELCRSGNVT